MAQYPTVQLVPGDDWNPTLLLTDANGDAVDYTGWTVEEAVVDYPGGSIDLSSDVSNAPNGIFVLSATETETQPVPYGAVSSFRLKIRSAQGVDLTPYYAIVKGVHSMASQTVTALQPGIQGKPGIGDKYDLVAWIQGLPQTGERVFRMVVARAFSLPAGLTDSQASAETAATGTAAFSLTKNDVLFGTVTFTASATGVLAAAAETTFAAGDVLEIIAPASQDATLSDISITLAGDRITT